MLSPSRDAIVDSFDEDFNKSVESLMRCEDFKSNFARRLSNRYITRSPMPGQRQDTPSKLRPSNKSADIRNHVPESIEICTQLSKSDNMEKNSKPVRPPDKYYKINEDIRNTEMNVLKMEVETLRWQLAQTEANRQMHIALLKQIVTFLNRVKDHFEADNKEDLPRESTRDLASSFNFNDLPRSRSVLHVNKNQDYAITPTKKISTRQISKSISNVNGYKDRNCLWSQPKLSRVPEHETSQKICEEMARLITLANTVLSTKLPDLACVCQGKNTEVNVELLNNEKQKCTTSSVSLDKINIDKQESAVVPEIGSNTNKEDNVKDINSNERNVSASSNSIILEEELPDINLCGKDNDEIKSETESPNAKVTHATDKLHEFNAVSNFIEDESGFSSMSSFQEIGIPIISIIPPSPCKEVGYLEEIPIILEETEKWKADASDKHSVKVFWV